MNYTVDWITTVYNVELNATMPIITIDCMKQESSPVGYYKRH